MSVATTEAGIGTRLETCPVHNIPFGQLFIPPVVGAYKGFWSGSCPKCEDANKAEERANEYLKSQEEAISNEATRIIQESAHQSAIEKRTKKDVAAELAKYEAVLLSAWRNYNTELEWNEIVCQIEERMRAEFLSAEKG